MNQSPELLAFPVHTEPAPPPKPHPIDVALGALSEAAADLLNGNRPSRFAELRHLASVAQAVQQLRPAPSLSVDDMGIVPGEINPNFAGEIIPHQPMRVMPGRWNDTADMNAQMLMMAQKFLEEYASIEKKKASRPDPDVRIDLVGELAELYELRAKLTLQAAAQDVPPEINDRISQLLTRIGEPTHEPSRQHESGTDLSPDPVRGHQADGTGQPDGCRVGEPVAE